MQASHACQDPTKIENFAISIVKTSYGNLHAGVTFRTSDDRLVSFHQAFHFKTLAEDVTSFAGPLEKQLHVRMPMLSDRAVSICEYWEFVASLGEPIGYALKEDPSATFDEANGKLVLSNGLGLSCATFVIALFRSVRVSLLDTINWPIGREGDLEAQRELVGLLNKYCQDQDHVEEVRSEVESRCARIRPEEVAGAALCTQFPVLPRRAEDCGYFVKGAVETQVRQP